MFYHKVHEEYYGGFSIISVKVRLAGPLDIQLVKQACRYIWEYSPVLRARIQPGTDGPCFVYDVPIRDIPVHSVFELGKTGILQFLEKEADTPFNSSRNLWRVLLITDKTEFDRHYLILSIHRSIGEVNFALQCAQDILRIASKILAGHPDDIPNGTIPGKGEGLDDAPHLSASEPQTGAFEDVIEFSVYASISRRRTHIRNYTVDPDRFKVLSSKCLEGKISLPGILGAVALTAMIKNFSVDSIGIEASCFAKGVLSSPGSFAFHVGGGDISSDIWETARTCDRKMADISGNGDYARVHARPISGINGIKHFPARCVIEIVSSLAAREPFSIDNIAVVHGNRCATEAVYLSAAIVGETLSLTYACAYPLMDDGRSERFVRDFAHLLDRAIKKTRN